MALSVSHDPSYRLALLLLAILTVFAATGAQYDGRKISTNSLCLCDSVVNEYLKRTTTESQRHRGERAQNHVEEPHHG